MAMTLGDSKMWLRNIALVSIGLWCAGCKKEEPTETAKPAESARPALKGLDPDLAEAMAAASARIGDPSAPAAAASGGPPPNGIFPPGAADKELKAGQPPKITLGSDGAEPRVALRPAQPKPGTKQNLVIRFSVQNSPDQQPLPIDFALTFEAMKPKGEEGMVDEIPVQAKVTSARIGVTGAPKELESSVARLKGSKIEYLVLPDGAGTSFRSEFPKGADESLGSIVRSLGDMLAIVTLPVPEKPVGVGAYWMATSRDSPLGLDLVTYRLVKVERVEGKRVTLDVNTKRYSATAAFDLPGLPPDVPHSAAEFQAIAQGTVVLEAGKGFPTDARQESAFGATLGTVTKGGQAARVEVHARAEIVSSTP